METSEPSTVEIKSPVNNINPSQEQDNNKDNMDIDITSEDKHVFSNFESLSQSPNFKPVSYTHLTLPTN